MNYDRGDVALVAIDDPATTLDESALVSAIAATAWGPGSCSGISGGRTFVQCLPGTNVRFSADEPKQLVDDRLEMDLLGGE